MYIIVLSKAYKPREKKKAKKTKQQVLCHSERLQLHKPL